MTDPNDDALAKALAEAIDAIENADPAVLTDTLWMRSKCPETVVDRLRALAQQAAPAAPRETELRQAYRAGFGAGWSAHGGRMPVSIARSRERDQGFEFWLQHHHAHDAATNPGAPTTPKLHPPLSEQEKKRILARREIDARREAEAHRFFGVGAPTP